VTFRTTVVNPEGQPIPNAYVSANLQVTGGLFSRFTDGNGYADVALLEGLQDDTLSTPVTFLVQADGFKTHVEYMTIEDPYDDREVVVALTPFA
jgi:hypothetical protein